MAKAIAVIPLLFFYLFAGAQSGKSGSGDLLDSAITGSNQSFATARKSGNPDSLFSSLTKMSLVYLQTGDYARSFDYAEQLYGIAISSGRPDFISNSLISLGNLYRAIHDYPHALNYYRRALVMGTSPGFASPSDPLELYIAEVYAHTARFDSAWHYYSLYTQRKDVDSGMYALSTGECFFMQGKYLRALENFESVFGDPRQKNNPRLLIDLAGSFAVLDKPDAAMPFARMGLRWALGTGTAQFIRDGYKIISDLFDQMGHTDSSNYYFRKYSVARDIVLNSQTRGRMAALTYEQEISRMNQENEIREISLQKQTLIKNGLLVGILLIVLSAFLFSRYLMAKRRAESRQRQIAENELKIQKLEAEKSNAELEQQKTELEIRALRAQMNPHFIFNCLNSINRFIIGNEAVKAADYLTKFARLIRIVLEKSGSPLVTLEEELQALRLYMDLEALRFETPFQYDIQSGGIDPEDWLLPSLIIQPFVENAIWHGFQTGQSKQGRIRIQLCLEKDFLYCAILDNGIGVSKANALNTTGRQHGKSLGIHFTTERLRLYANQESVSPVSVEELKDESGNITGTGVYLVIPVEPA